ncbi:hypothetical protein JB92DRAFT_2854526 [Gautieria morchelliformis]|nr:hypothetical protein JB92DRAFT_2854526 [Gautieria morchelliformis]
MLVRICSRRPFQIRPNMAFRSLSSEHRTLLSRESTSIRLTELETRICSLLDDFTKALGKENQSVECCIAGGWVRDKLLGLESNDIDIALSTMMGFPFATKFAEYLRTRGISATQVTKVESRADQSKHLETAKLSLLGVDLDFVNLRSEEYAEGSRIPTRVAFGTKREDTMRRDITINALLYNIHTHSVEDHTRKGLDDLRHGIIRTPLPPKQTFLDDPLRVLRCIRFASRFGYDLVPELVEAAREREIQDALETKISRERIGDEECPDPLRAIKLIDHLALHVAIFTPPPAFGQMIFRTEPLPLHSGLAAAAVLHHFECQLSPGPDSSSMQSRVENNTPSQTSPESQKPVNLPSPSAFSERLRTPHPTLLKGFNADLTTRQRLYLASALTPFRRLKIAEKKDKFKLAVETCIRDGLKLGIQNHYIDGIPALYEASDLLHQPKLKNLRVLPLASRSVSLLLRDKRVHNKNTGSHWTSSVLFSLVQELVTLWDPVKDTFDVDSANETISLYDTFVSKLEDLRLQSSLDDRPILDGRDVSKLLSKQPGPWTGHVLDQVIKWQLGNPNGTKDQCASWLEEEVNAGRLSLDTSGKKGQSKAAGDGPPSKKAKVS